jgi:sigma-B regulation protein RsbU (phosphoserine phosphatase)
MLIGHRPWQEELEIIDKTMRTISSIRDPEELVGQYWQGIGKLIPAFDYVSVSRRNVEKPYYLLTRSSRFKEDLNPWTQRDRLPRMKGGLIGEFIYGNKPVIMDDLPARLTKDDPARYYLEGSQSLLFLPQYDGGEGINGTVLLPPPGMELDKTMIPMMHWQASLFGRGTTNLVLRNQLGEALSALDRELQVVGEIQRSLLPQQLPEIEGFEVAASYQTSARAGGDYYDFFPLHGGRWGMFIADVSGHGTPAAVLMAITHAIAHAQPGTHTPPEVLLKYLNRQLESMYTHAGTFVTAFYGVLDPAKRTLSYSCAGHDPPRLVRDGKVMSLDGAASLPLGIVAEQEYGEEPMKLERGDTLLLYTDGITEAMPPVKEGSSPNLFGTQRLDQVLLEESASSAMQCIERIRVEVDKHSEHAPPTDDRTLIAIRCR